MSDRIYTIPAREVVPGMIWNDLPLQHVHDHGDWITLAWGDGENDAMSLQREYDVTIRLPGPSPRELLCSCDWRVIGGEQNGGTYRHPPDMTWRAHSEVCPVYRLRLRLWPVGATWNGEQWLVPWPPYIEGETMRVNPDTLDVLLTNDLLPELRAAFCEPEVQR